ncbi:MAG: hypothetical protein GY757_12920 [bacterium]|nr:hypothetical protein [bacterium]
MEIIDFNRSFITTLTPPGNMAYYSRLQVEALCRIQDEQAGTTMEYYFYASCKGENAFVPEKLFKENSYDFCGIFSEGDDIATFRTFVRHRKVSYECGKASRLFEEVHRDIKRRKGKELKEKNGIVRSILENKMLVGRVEFTAKNETVRVELEFPIKTINAGKKGNLYQVDTGPVAFPDFDIESENHINKLRPAFVAYNSPHYAEFVLQVPTKIPVGELETEVTHYSKIKKLNAQTSIIAVD